MGFTIITTISPDFADAWRWFLPAWYANSGADEIVVHRIDEPSWAKNVMRGSEILADEIGRRAARREKVLALDADCLVLRDLSGGFSDTHHISVARWPSPNMGVAFFNTAMPLDWVAWMGAGVDELRRALVASDDPEAGYSFDQPIWHRRLKQPGIQVCRLDEHEWNYNRTELDQWKKDLPTLRGTVRVVHFKHHGQWAQDKLDYLASLFPKETSCIP